MFYGKFLFSIGKKEEGISKLDESIDLLKEYAGDKKIEIIDKMYTDVLRIKAECIQD